MCYWVGSKKVRESILKHFQQDPNDEISQLFYTSFVAPDNPNSTHELQEYFVAVGKSKPMLTALVKEHGVLSFKNIQWTLQWTYFDKKSQQIKEGRPLLNSSCEKVFWQHKDLIYTQRCIIPIDGYWEFFHFNGTTFPHFIYPANKDLFYIGGIWNTYSDKQTGEITDTLSILTTPPNKIARKLHNNPKAPNGSRMLLILDYQQIHHFLDESLNSHELRTHFFKPYPDEKMLYHPTIQFLKKENREWQASIKVQEPFNYTELIA
ncbi:MAG: SOS response-associated peptidase family protein [Salinivirgaceae bacterium]